jgi:hypothetical protein
MPGHDQRECPLERQPLAVAMRLPEPIELQLSEGQDRGLSIELPAPVREARFEEN